MVTVVVGGQFGSEGKGAVCGYLHKKQPYDYAVRIGGPNAGHTIYDDTGRGYPLRSIPVAAVCDPRATLIVAAGSEIDLKVLEGEVELLEADGHSVLGRLVIDPEATLIEDHHLVQESGLANGTTGKGIGAARSSRLMRMARRVADVQDGWLGSDRFRWQIGVVVGDTGAILRRAQSSSNRILIEGTQGYGLGSHAGLYPHCTSGDCRAIDFMAQAGLAPSAADVWVVLRTHPIRIAGNSGPLRGEMDWGRVGVPAEYTTVTKKMRRVGEWDTELAHASVQANGGRDASVALTFADYWWPYLSGCSAAFFDAATEQKLSELEDEIGSSIDLLGTGPSTHIERS
jgi:adenylosuccinate synthase